MIDESIGHDIPRQGLSAAPCRLRLPVAPRKVQSAFAGGTMTPLRFSSGILFASVLLIVAGNAQTATESPATSLPAGTRIVARLRSPLNTTSAVPESGVYLESAEPVVIADRVVIPAHSLIQGEVEADKRPGHFDRSSHLRVHFTTLILPNNHVATIDGQLQSIPGSGNYRKKGQKGTAATVDQVEKTLPQVGGLAVAGAIIGSVRHFGIGMFPGAGLGTALGLGRVLIRRGDEIWLPEGSRMEVVLNSPISIPDQVIVENNERARRTSMNANTGGSTAHAAPTDRPKPAVPPLSPRPTQQQPLFWGDILNFL
jgi:hypothetical protein